MRYILKFANKLWNKRIIRFLCVGTFNTTLDFGILLTLYKVFALPEVVANTASVLIAITTSYFLNHRVVFRQKHGYRLGAYVKFVLITGFSAVAIQDTIIFLVTKVLLEPNSETTTIAGFNFAISTLTLMAAKAIGVSIGLVWNFMLYKYVVFSGKQPQDQDKADEVVIA